ncbi:putative DNA primase/helicase [Nitrosospira multiformis]|uniref:Putative DNA primase/helicase n=1 Tax=Nitrosospira multiformis TaxID=1231 RepID=A0A1H8G651_9PROT|nr:toprim domain-containing protein [Nitrosospira multiformis]SEN39230.1 putative DNA primase/helicase [Nitrosospira multiformis]
MIRASLPPALVEFMHRHQYRPEPLKPSGGGFFRFPVGNKVNGNASGYVKLFPDGNIAVFGDFKSGQQITWHAKNLEGLLPPEWKAYQVQIEKARQEAKNERDRLHAEAAERASKLYNIGTNPNPDHTYLVRKSIRPHDSLRQLGKRLIIPIYIDGKLTSLQFIKEDGSKLFLKDGEIFGGYCLLGEPAEAVCIAEGFATACSIHEVTGHSVAVAFNAGNLLPVSKAIRRHHPESTIILCADHDQWTEGNPGLTKATQAAIAVDALLAVPNFSQCDMGSRPTDFNDLHVLVGQEAVRHAFAVAQKPAHLPEPTSDALEHYLNEDSQLESTAGLPIAAPAMTEANVVSLHEIEASGRPKVISSTDFAEIPLRDQPQMAEVGFVPLIRDIVTAACDSSEAHPVAVAANAISYFSALMGRGIFQPIGDAVIHCRPFVLIVGKSGKARKGTSEVTVTKIFKRAEVIINERTGLHDYLNVYKGALSTGEGIAMHIRDPREADEKGKGGDAGVLDKRMLVIETEFDNVFSHVRRDNNNLSATIRTVFDGHDIKTLTKTDPISASRPHVCITGHITGHELRIRATENDVANGLLNRFLMAHVYRPKLVALPQPTPKGTIEELGERVANMIVVVTNGDLHANNVREVILSEAARELWVEQYKWISRDREGRGGSLLARSEMYARMLAMIFAAMEGRVVIEPTDLHAAFAWIEYWNASITYVFNCKDDEGALAPFVTEVLEKIIKNPGLTLTALQGMWLNKRIKEVRNALELLLNLAPPLIEQRKEATGGRPVLRYFPYEKK